MPIPTVEVGIARGKPPQRYLPRPFESLPSPPRPTSPPYPSPLWSNETKRSWWLRPFPAQIALPIPETARSSRSHKGDSVSLKTIPHDSATSVPNSEFRIMIQRRLLLPVFLLHLGPRKRRTETIRSCQSFVLCEEIAGRQRRQWSPQESTSGSGGSDLGIVDELEVWQQTRESSGPK